MQISLTVMTPAREFSTCARLFLLLTRNLMTSHETLLASGQWFPAVPGLNSWVLRAVVLSLSSKLLRTKQDRCGGHIGPKIASPRSRLSCERETRAWRRGRPTRQSEATSGVTDAGRRRIDGSPKTPMTLKISWVSHAYKGRTNHGSTCGVKPHGGSRRSRALDGRQTVGGRGCDLL